MVHRSALDLPRLSAQPQHNQDSTHFCGRGFSISAVSRIFTHYLRFFRILYRKKRNRSRERERKRERRERKTERDRQTETNRQTERDRDRDNLPQKGIPWGDQVPFSPQTRLAGPSSSKPRSHVYSAMVPAETASPAPASLQTPNHRHYINEKVILYVI